MASVNPHTRELVFKLVFYGPGLGGKTTTLQYIHAATKAEHRGKMVSLATPTDRTLYFDFLPVRLPRVRGMAVRLQLFTVPGQAYYAATRKLVLSGADGVVFVADSQNGRMDVNEAALDDLHKNLAEDGRTLEELPHTFQWNKRDLADLVPTEELDRRLNKFGAPSLGTVALRGDGVFEGLERIARRVLKTYENDPIWRIEATASPDGKALASTDPETSIVPEKAMADALRGMEAQAHLDPPTKVLAVVSEAGTEEQGSPSTSVFHGPKQSPLAPAPDDEPKAERERQRGFSLADLWPESERERVCNVEAMLAARDATLAILACDELVTRVLASVAGLVGTLDAPRDPALVALLLGLDGARYLRFRATVRAARHGDSVSMRDALEGFVFALEVRSARARLRA